MSTFPRLSGLLFALLALAAPALAGLYDLVYTDSIDATLCENGCGITLSGCDFGVLVNTGTASISAEDVASALGPTAPGGAAILTLTGRLKDGTPFESRDCLHVVGPSPPDSGIVEMEVPGTPSPHSIQVRYTLATDANVDLAVYDVTGRRLESLVRARQPGGQRVAEWLTGNRPAGVYFFRLVAAGQAQMRRFVLLK